MTIFKVKVKWGKEMYTDVEVDTDELPMLFKAQLFALTGVQPERQKVMIKGETLKDDEWDTIKLKDGMMVLLMGSKEELPSAPQDRPIFMEDMSESELKTALELPSGLTNLGNTCYMNATVQCLRSVPELRQSLDRFQGDSSVASSMVPSQSITVALRDLYGTMDNSATISPNVLLRVMHVAFPRFAEKAEQGGFIQQDANEFWTEMMRMLQQKLQPLNKDHTSLPVGGATAKTYNSFIDQYFGGTFDVTLKCTESEDEPASHNKEDFLQLSCFISTDVKYMHTGLKSKLISAHARKHRKAFANTQQRRDLPEDDSKRSSCPFGNLAALSVQTLKTKDLLSVSAEKNENVDLHIFVNECQISRLPAYLTVQFVRFFYKEKEAINAKILKDVKFSLSLDVFDLCSPELQNKLMPMRSKFKDIEDAELENIQKGKHLKKKGEKPPSSKKRSEPFMFSNDPGSNNSGYYELTAVLTHRGRSSSSGHYVAWVKRNNDEWCKCDDDKVTIVTSEEILKLSGGGDWHCAYVLLYGPRVLEIDEDDSKMETAESS